MKNEKYLPKVGDNMNLHNYYSGSCTPYTVVDATPKRVLVQKCELLFKGNRYYDTVADEIRPNPNGTIEELHWSGKSGAYAIVFMKYGFKCKGKIIWASDRTKMYRLFAKLWRQYPVGCFEMRNLFAGDDEPIVYTKEE